MHNMSLGRRRAAGKRASYNRACAECSKVKKKCDGSRPCSRCARLGLPCTDKIDHRFRKREREEEEAAMGELLQLPKRAAAAPASQGAATPTSQQVASAAGNAGAATPLSASLAALSAVPGLSALPQATLLGLGLLPLLQQSLAGASSGSVPHDMSALGGPATALAALSNPNNALSQLLSQALLSSAGGQVQTGPTPPAWAQAVPPPRPADHPEAPPSSGSGSSTTSARLQTLLQRNGNFDQGGQVVNKVGIPCLMRDITGSMELPCGLEGVDPLVYHPSTLQLARCPMPSCRMVFDAQFRTCVSVHANRGIAGLYNWCNHDLVTSVNRLPALVSFVEPSEIASRMEAAQDARQRGLARYSVRSTFLRPTETSPGGFYDPMNAEWERFAATEVVHEERASNGALVVTITLMDFAELPEDVRRVSKTAIMAAAAVGKRTAELVDAHVAQCKAKLRAQGATSVAAAHAGAVPKDGKFSSAKAAVGAASATVPGLGNGPMLFEARTSLHINKTKCLLSTSHKGLGCLAYLAYLMGAIWTGSPALTPLVQELRGFPPPPLKSVGGRVPHPTPGARVAAASANMPSLFSSATHPTVFSSQSAAGQGGGGVPGSKVPAPEPPSSAPALESLSAAAMVALQAEIDSAQSKGDALASKAASSTDDPVHGSDGKSSSGGVPVATNRVWEAMSVPGPGSLANGSLGGAPGSELFADTLSVSAFSLGTNVSDAALDGLMHPMAAGGVRAVQPVVPPSGGGMVRVVTMAGDVVGSMMG